MCGKDCHCHQKQHKCHKRCDCRKKDDCHHREADCCAYGNSWDRSCGRVRLGSCYIRKLRYGYNRPRYGYAAYNSFNDCCHRELYYGYLHF